MGINTTPGDVLEIKTLGNGWGYTLTASTGYIQGHWREGASGSIFTINNATGTASAVIQGSGTSYVKSTLSVNTDQHGDTLYVKSEGSNYGITLVDNSETFFASMLRAVAGQGGHHELANSSNIVKARISAYDNSYLMNSFGVGLTSPTARVHIQGSTSDSTAYALKVDNSPNSAILYAQNDKKVGIATSTIASWVTLQVGSGASGGNWLRVYGSGSDINIGQSSGSFFGYASGDVALIENESNKPFAIGTWTNQNLEFGVYNQLRARIDTNGDFDVINPGVYKIHGTAGFTGTGAYTNFTIVGGIITSAS